MNEYYALQTCMNKTYACVENWKTETKQNFDYVLVSQNGLSDSGNSLVESMLVSATYQLAYQEADIAIFKKSH
jgi:hypothetical protein